MHSSAEVLLDKYEGDLFKLREAAKEKPDAERKKLQEIKGLAKVWPQLVWGRAPGTLQLLLGSGQQRRTCGGGSLPGRICNKMKLGLLRNAAAKGLWADLSSRIVHHASADPLRCSHSAIWPCL